MNSLIQETASFLRWRLVPVRYLGRLPRLNRRNLFAKYTPQHSKAREMEKTGFTEGPTVSPELLGQLQKSFQKRSLDKKQVKKKIPFINLSTADDLTPESPLMKLAFSPEILDVALDYYSGQCRLDKLQVLYSFPSDSSDLSESQKWHLDFSDSRSFHSITYLNDVLDDEGGPFVFADKVDSRSIGKGPIIRRIADAQFNRELGNGHVRKFLAKAGSTIMMDPAVCYHYGSRCRFGRLAIFATFSSDKPFFAAQKLLVDNKAKILETAMVLRPDLDKIVLARLLDI